MKLFKKFSDRLGVDVDKVIFEKDGKEKRKLGRSLLKETMRERTRIIEKEDEDE